jgi:hypothetical protein
MSKTTIPNKGDKNYWQYMKEAGVEAIKETKLGRPRKIESPEKLWEYACEYFEQVDNNPFKREEFIRGGDKAGKKVSLNSMMPYTWAGLDEYLIKHRIISSIEDYRQNRNGAYDDFLGVITRINQVMWNQKFSGAAVGALKENIIARELGMYDNEKELKISPDSKITVTVNRLVKPAKPKE